MSRFAGDRKPYSQDSREIFDSAGEDTIGMPGARCLLGITLQGTLRRPQRYLRFRAFLPGTGSAGMRQAMSATVI